VCSLKQRRPMNSRSSSWSSAYRPGSPPQRLPCRRSREPSKISTTTAPRATPGGFSNRDGHEAHSETTTEPPQKGQGEPLTDAGTDPKGHSDPDWLMRERGSLWPDALPATSVMFVYRSLLGD